MQAQAPRPTAESIISLLKEQFPNSSHHSLMPDVVKCIAESDDYLCYLSSCDVMARIANTAWLEKGIKEISQSILDPVTVSVTLDAISDDEGGQYLSAVAKCSVYSEKNKEDHFVFSAENEIYDEEESSFLDNVELTDCGLNLGETLQLLFGDQDPTKLSALINSIYHLVNDHGSESYFGHVVETFYPPIPRTDFAFFVEPS